MAHLLARLRIGALPLDRPRAVQTLMAAEVLYGVHTLVHTRYMDMPPCLPPASSRMGPQGSHALVQPPPEGSFLPTRGDRPCLPRSTHRRCQAANAPSPADAKVRSYGRHVGQRGCACSMWRRASRDLLVGAGRSLELARQSTQHRVHVELGTG
ncbi:hypothetical protein J1614_010177 [Plenodomus biglobosus]|nr:hypothetical protein J1614_010177 [Plenodomus biglobosus]